MPIRVTNACATPEKPITVSVSATYATPVFSAE